MNDRKTMKHPHVDVILVNYNSTDHLLPCLKSIYDASRGLNIRVWVQDNASKDNVDRITNSFPEVSLIKNDKNLGFARAVNRSLFQGSAPFILILNPDTILSPGFFGPLLEYMETHGDVGIIGPRILDTDETVQGSARAFPTLLTALFGRRSILTRFFPDNPITRENILTSRSDGVSPMAVDWVSGACMLVRREALMRVGPMDNRFFMYWEDADWCRNMWQNGWKVIYFPRSSIVHFAGVSSDKNIFRSVLEFHKSIYRLFEKHARSPHSFLRPLIFWGLIYRFLFVIFSQGISILFHRGLGFSPGERRGHACNDGRIKLLRFIARLNIGGPSIHVYLLTKGLDPAKFHSILVTGKISHQEGDMSYLFESLSEKPIVIDDLQREIRPWLDIRAFLKILALLHTENPSIVDTHTAKAGTTARLAVILYNSLHRKQIRTVHTFHGHVFEGYFSKIKSSAFIWVERLLARGTDIIVAISASQKRDLSEKFKIAPPCRIKTIPLGFDLKPFLSSRKFKGQLRKRLGIPESTAVVGIIGRLVPIKNHRMFFDAAKRFLESHPERKAVFLVVGDGELRERLEQYTRDSGIASNVRFMGWMRNLPFVYADVDILALTSLNEGTPFSIIEAMASSVPVIAAGVGGVPDLLGKSEGRRSRASFEVHERGILCKNGDARGFAEGLQFLMEIDSNERSARVDRARVFVEEQFSEKRLLRDMETLYQELVRGKTTKGTLSGCQRCLPV